jgi:hypothetical protein
MWELATAVAQQSGLHALVETREGCLIGGVQNGRRVVAEKIENSIKSPLNVNLYAFQNSRPETLVSEDGECHRSWKSQTGVELNGLMRGYHLSAIADLNGDGCMEIVLYSAYYEGSSSDIFEINGMKAHAVLVCGCEH